MPNYKERDLVFIKETSDGWIDGDLAIENGDLMLTGDYESARQDLIIRARTIKGELRNHPQFGTNMEQLIGQPNTERTAKIGAFDLYHAFTYDARFSATDLTIRPVPTSITEMHFYVFLTIANKRLVTVSIPIDLG